MPRFQFTLRRMMVMVAVVALCLVGGAGPARKLMLRANDFREISIENGSMSKVAATAQTIHLQHLARATSQRDIQSYASLATNQRAMSDYFARLERKYRWASRLPFLPVAPDPPQPKGGH